MSYFRYIKGRRYDRELIEFADQLIKKHVRITLEEAQELWAEVSDAGKITSTERDTLRYLLATYGWDTKARQWIIEQAGLNMDETGYNESEIREILNDYGLDEMTLIAPRKLIGNMLQRFLSKVSFAEAIDLAIHTIINDESNRNSPRAVLMDVLETYPDQFENYDDFDRIIRPELIRRMNDGYLMLVPIWEEIPENEREFNSPENREASERYWIFYLGIVTDDHQFWTIVDRLGNEKPYNYGYN